MCTGSTFTFFVVQKPLVYQCVADGCNRNTGTDIIGKEQDDLPQQRRVCDLLLTSAFFSLQNVTNHDCGIDTVEKRQCLFLLQPNINNAWHPAEAHIGIKNLPQFIAFTVLVEYLFAKSTKCTLCFTNFKTVKIKELTERERQHFDFHTPSG